MSESVFGLPWEVDGETSTLIDPETEDDVISLLYKATIERPEYESMVFNAPRMWAAINQSRNAIFAWMKSRLEWEQAGFPTSGPVFAEHLEREKALPSLCSKLSTLIEEMDIESDRRNEDDAED